MKAGTKWAMEQAGLRVEAAKDRYLSIFLTITAAIIVGWLLWVLWGI